PLVSAFIAGLRAYEDWRPGAHKTLVVCRASIPRSFGLRARKCATSGTPDSPIDCVSKGLVVEWLPQIVDGAGSTCAIAGDPIVVDHADQRGHRQHDGPLPVF